MQSLTGGVGVGGVSSSLAALTPSLANHYRDDLVNHVRGWPADVCEKQVIVSLIFKIIIHLFFRYYLFLKLISVYLHDYILLKCIFKFFSFLIPLINDIGMNRIIIIWGNTISEAIW